MYNTPFGQDLIYLSSTLVCIWCSVAKKFLAEVSWIIPSLSACEGSHQILHP